MPSTSAKDRLFVILFGIVDVVLMSRDQSDHTDSLKELLQSYEETVKFVSCEIPRAYKLSLGTPENSQGLTAPSTSCTLSPQTVP